MWEQWKIYISVFTRQIHVEVPKWKWFRIRGQTNDDLSAAWTESATSSKSINIHLGIQYPWDSSVQCFWSDALSCFNSYPGNFTCKIIYKTT